LFPAAYICRAMTGTVMQLFSCSSFGFFPLTGTLCMYFALLPYRKSFFMKMYHFLHYHSALFAYDATRIFIRFVLNSPW
jgi:hypothetical protein